MLAKSEAKGMPLHLDVAKLPVSRKGENQEEDVDICSFDLPFKRRKTESQDQTNVNTNAAIQTPANVVIDTGMQMPMAPLV